MQNPVISYLDILRETRRSELTIKATRQTLQSFQAWWETDRNRPFDLAGEHKKVGGITCDMSVCSL